MADAGGIGAGDAPAQGGGEFAPEHGWLAQEVREELPELRLVVVETNVAQGGSLTGRSPSHVKARLRQLSDRFRGGRAVSVRREPVPAAYRPSFTRSGWIRTSCARPLEAVVLERMLHGGFASEGLLSDVLLIALVDTGVAVWALDAGSIDGPLGIRPTREGEPLGRSGDSLPLPAGRLAVADASAALGLLFEEPASAHRPSDAARRVTLFAIQVAGVPTLYVEEALWSCCVALGAG